LDGRNQSRDSKLGFPLPATRFALARVAGSGLGQRVAGSG